MLKLLTLGCLLLQATAQAPLDARLQEQLARAGPEFVTDAGVTGDAVLAQKPKLEARTKQEQTRKYIPEASSKRQKQLDAFRADEKEHKYMIKAREADRKKLLSSGDAASEEKVKAELAALYIEEQQVKTSKQLKKQRDERSRKASQVRTFKGEIGEQYIKLELADAEASLEVAGLDADALRADEGRAKVSLAKDPKNAALVDAEKRADEAASKQLLQVEALKVDEQTVKRLSADEQNAKKAQQAKEEAKERGDEQEMKEKKKQAQQIKK